MTAPCTLTTRLTLSGPSNSPQLLLPAVLVFFNCHRCRDYFSRLGKPGEATAFMTSIKHRSESAAAVGATRPEADILRIQIRG